METKKTKKIAEKELISCSTCKYNIPGKSCIYSYEGCLQKKGRTDLPNLHKRNPDYYYFKWEPKWSHLPDDLFEI